jgi:hypothetical protein
MNDLAIYQAACQPSEDAMILGWLGRLMCGVGNPPDEEAAPAKLAAMLLALRGMPAGVWNMTSASLSGVPVLANSSDVYALLKPHAVSADNARTLRGSLPRSQFATVKNQQRRCSTSRGSWRTSPLRPVVQPPEDRQTARYLTHDQLSGRIGDVQGPVVPHDPSR